MSGDAHNRLSPGEHELIGVGKQGKPNRIKADHNRADEPSLHSSIEFDRDGAKSKSLALSSSEIFPCNSKYLLHLRGLARQSAPGVPPL